MKRASSSGDRVRRSWFALTLLATVAPFGLAIALAPDGKSAPGPTLAWLLFMGTSVHVAATAWLYSLPEVRACAHGARTRHLVAPLMLVAAGAAAAGVLSIDQFAWVLAPFLAWQLFHFQRQNLGLVALTARATRSPALDQVERRIISACAIAGIAGLVARPERLQLDVDPHLHWLFPIAAAAYGALAVVGLVRVARRFRTNDPAVVGMFVASYSFFAPVFIFGSPYAAVAGLTLAHGLQYLVLLGFVGAARQRAQVFAGAALLIVALLGGAVLHQTSHLHDADTPAARALFGAYLGVVMAHFVVDAGLWRLRDSGARRFVATYLPELVEPSASTRLAAAD